MTINDAQAAPGVSASILTGTFVLEPCLRAGYNSEVPDLSRWQQFDNDHPPLSRLEVVQRFTALSVKQWSCRWSLWTQSIADKHR